MTQGRDAFNFWLNKQFRGYPAYNDFLLYVRSKGQPTEGITYLNFKEHPLYKQWVGVMEWAQTSGKAGTPPSTREQGLPWRPTAPATIPTVRERMGEVGLPTEPWDPAKIVPWEEADEEEQARRLTDPNAKGVGMLPQPGEGQDYIWQIDPATNKGRWTLGVAGEETSGLGAGMGYHLEERTIFGRNVLVRVDDDTGEMIGVESVFEEDTGPEWRPGELELQQQQLAWQQSQGAASDKLRREELLASLTGPQDWIKYWQMRNPPRTIDPAESYRTQLQSVSSSIEQVEQQLATEFGTHETWGQEGNREQIADLAKTLNSMEKMRSDITKLMETAGAPYTTQKTPPTPEWLPQYVPSQMAGQPIAQSNVRTPSGQQFAGMAESQRAGLAGYANWAAPTSRTWGDIMSHMEMMQPSTPSGAGRERWQPASQRV